MAIDRRQQFFRARGADEDRTALDQFEPDATITAGDVCLATASGADAVATPVASGIVGDDLRRLDLLQWNVPLAPKTTHSNGKLVRSDMRDQANRHQTKVDQPEEDRPADDPGIGHGLRSPGVAQDHLPDQEHDHSSGWDNEQDKNAPLAKTLLFTE